MTFKRVPFPLLFKLSWKRFPWGFHFYSSSLKQNKTHTPPSQAFQELFFFHSICSSSERKKQEEWFVPKCMFNKAIETVWIKQNSNCSAVWAVPNSCCNTLFQWIIWLLQRAKHLNYEATPHWGHDLWCRSPFIPDIDLWHSFRT